jgi:hypothetical protein
VRGKPLASHKSLPAFPDILMTSEVNDLG